MKPAGSALFWSKRTRTGPVLTQYSWCSSLFLESSLGFLLLENRGILTPVPSRTAAVQLLVPLDRRTAGTRPNRNQFNQDFPRMKPVWIFLTLWVRNAPIKSEPVSGFLWGPICRFRLRTRGSLDAPISDIYQYYSFAWAFNAIP